LRHSRRAECHRRSAISLHVKVRLVVEVVPTIALSAFPKVTSVKLVEIRDCSRGGHGHGVDGNRGTKVGRVAIDGMAIVLRPKRHYQARRFGAPLRGCGA